MAIQGVDIIEIPEFRDERGALCFAETPRHFPFEVRRVFFMYDLPANAHRGGHAHRTCHQMLICLSGALGLAVACPAGKGDYVLDSPRHALHLPPLSWVDITILKPGTIGLVLTSHAYDPADYINDWAEFNDLCG